MGFSIIESLTVELFGKSSRTPIASGGTRKFGTKTSWFNIITFQFEDGSRLQTIESYEAALSLGYAQQSSLRKQTLTDWRGHFLSWRGDTDSFGSALDYLMIHDADILKDYEERYAKGTGMGIKPMDPERGRLFFTANGMKQVLLRSTKEEVPEFRSFLEKSGFFDEPLKPVLVPPVVSMETRKYEYEILLKLLRNLEKLEDPMLRSLAITTAETGLGRTLGDVRLAEETRKKTGRPKTYTARTLEPVSSEPEPLHLLPDISSAAQVNSPQPELDDPAATNGPIFKEHGFYSCTRIGEMAGGYSSVTVGLAANVVAKRMGFTKQQIRHEKLPFNEVFKLQVASGDEKDMFRFNRDFSNDIIKELRTRSYPKAAAKAPAPLTAFGGVPHPKLSEDLDLDDLLRDEH